MVYRREDCQNKNHAMSWPGEQWGPLAHLSLIASPQHQYCPSLCGFITLKKCFAHVDQTRILPIVIKSRQKYDVGMKHAHTLYKSGAQHHYKFEVLQVSTTRGSGTHLLRINNARHEYEKTWPPSSMFWHIGQVSSQIIHWRIWSFVSPGATHGQFSYYCKSCF
jgi:hypothetical protein